MEFIKEPELREINGGWCLFINNEDCGHSCGCDGCYDICGIEADVCGCDTDYGC